MLRAVFVQAGITKLEHIVEVGSWRSAEEMVRLTGTHSVRFIKKLLTEIQNVVPEEAKHCLLSPMELLEDLDYFPEFGVRPAVRERKRRANLCFRHPD